MVSTCSIHRLHSLRVHFWHSDIGLLFQHHDSDKKRSTSRYGSTSRRAVIASRASSAGEANDIPKNRRLSTGSRIHNPAERIQLAMEAKTGRTATRGSRDDHPLRSFELLNIKK